MEAKDVIGIDGFALAHIEVHAGNHRIAAHRGKRIALEIEVGHRINDQIIRRGNPVLQ